MELYVTEISKYVITLFLFLYNFKLFLNVLFIRIKRCRKLCTGNKCFVYGDKIKFTALNTSKARRVAIGQKVLGLPVIAIYKDGEKVEELVKDDATKEAVEEMIKKYYEMI